MNALVGSDSKRLWSLLDMIEFDVPAVLMFAKEVGRLVRHFESMEQTELLGSEEIKQSYIQGMDYQINGLNGLGLRMSALQAAKVKNNLDKNVGEISKMLAELHSRLTDECSLRFFACFSQKEVDFIFPERPLFGETVGQKFPSCAFEIEEAGKCLGFSRNTAAVFHLMRALEVAIKAIGCCLDIPDPIKPSEKKLGSNFTNNQRRN
jgi:hypothetical protein